MSFPAPGLSWQARGWGEGRGGRSRWSVGAQPADAAPPLPVGRQESRHLLCKLSDDNHHLMAPKRQRGPCLQRLWPLLQAAQCESAPPRPSPGTTALCAARRGAPATVSSVAWLGRRWQPGRQAPSARRASRKRGQAGWKCVPQRGALQVWGSGASLKQKVGMEFGHTNGGLCWRLVGSTPCPVGPTQ